MELVGLTIRWAALRKIRLHKGRTVFVFEDDGQVRQRAALMKPDERARLHDAWLEQELLEVERSGAYRARACPLFPGLRPLLGIGGTFALSVASCAFWLAAELNHEPGVSPMIVAVAAGVTLITGLALIGVLQDRRHRRRWHRLRIGEAGITRHDADGHITETPWSRIDIDARKILVDGVRLDLTRISGSDLARRIFVRVQQETVKDALVARVPWLGLSLTSG